MAEPNPQWLIGNRASSEGSFQAKAWTATILVLLTQQHGQQQQ